MTTDTAHDSSTTIIGDDVASGDLPIGLRPLISAGVHFGHQTQRWNPRMRPYIFGARNGIHIIDLDQTAQLFKRAFNFIAEAVGRGGSILFVGTKPQASDIVREHAMRAGQFFVVDRWLGGTLTNFRTVKSSIDRLHSLEQQLEEGSFEGLTKREALGRMRDKEKLEKYLGGIKLMTQLPAAIVIVDPNHEHLAVREGRKLRIPIVALTDTNCNPSDVDYIIPGNDDAIRSIRLMISRLADACIEGSQKQRQYIQENYAQGGSSQGVQVEFTRGRRPSAKPTAEAQPDAVATPDGTTVVNPAIETTDTSEAKPATENA